MNSSAYNCIVCVCLVFVITAWTSHAWNVDYRYDDGPHFVDTFDSSAAAAPQRHHSFHYQPSCNCIKLRECTTITFRIRAAPKPLTIDFIRNIQKNACGFIGNDPYICCPPPPSPPPPPSTPSIDIVSRSFRDVHGEKPWIWDVVNDKNGEAPKPLDVPSTTNIFDRIGSASNPNTWDNFNFPRPNDFNAMSTNQKPYRNKDVHMRKIHFPNFEDPHTFRNCPPSFSSYFNIPSHFQQLQPPKKIPHIPNHDYIAMPSVQPTTHSYTHTHSAGFDSNSVVDTDPSIVFPSRSNAAIDTSSFPSRSAKFPSEKLNLVNQPNCGVSIGARIIGGTNSMPGQFPWMARLAYRNRSRSSQRVSYRCSAAVISGSPLYVLTSAHCVTNLVDDLELVYVRLGELDTRKNLCDNNRNLCTEPQDYEIESIVHHPGYDTPKYANDIALIRLRRQTNSNFITALCLPLGNYEAIDKNLNHKTGIVVGWSMTKQGANSLPQYLQLPIVDTKSCAESYARFSANSRTPIIINDSQICAQGTADRDTCQGDSGGPFMREDPQTGRYVLLGLVSFGPRSCGVTSFPGVLSRTSAYMEWIINNMQL